MSGRLAVAVRCVGWMGAGMFRVGIPGSRCRPRWGPVGAATLVGAAALLSGLGLPDPGWAQEPPTAPPPRSLQEVEAALDTLQANIENQETVLREWVTVYRVLDSVGAATVGRPLHSAGVDFSPTSLRYTAAQLLTLPDPSERVFLELPRYLDPPVVLAWGTRTVRTVRELRDVYRSMSDGVGGVLADIRRMDAQRLELEAERTWLTGEGEHRTQGPGSGRRPELVRADADALVQEAIQLFRQQRYRDARVPLDRALDLAPDHAWALTIRGFVSYFGWKDLSAAEADFNRALSLEPGRTEAMVGRGLVRIDVGSFMDGVQDLQAACEGRNEEGCQRVRELAIDREREGVQAWEADDTDNAHRLFSEAIAIDPRYPDSWFDRGRSWEVKGDFPRAIQDFLRFIQEHENAAAYARARPVPMPAPDPTGIAEAYLRAALGTASLGQLAQSIPYFDRAVEHIRSADPSLLPAYLYHRGQVYYEMGDRENALRDLHSACINDDQRACEMRDLIRGGGRRP